MIEFNKFIIKHKSSWLATEYLFCDEQEKVLYRTKSKKFGRIREILNAQGIPVYSVRMNYKGFKTLFHIMKSEQLLATVRAKSAFAASKFIIENSRENLQVEVKNKYRTFTIFKDDIEIAQCNTKKLGWFKYEFGIAMKEGADPVLMMSIVMTLDVIKRMRQAAAGAA